MKHAVILLSTNVVENIVIWDGVTQWNPLGAIATVRLEEGEPCDIGWIYDGTKSPRFTKPTE